VKETNTHTFSSLKTKNERLNMLLKITDAYKASCVENNWKKSIEFAWETKTIEMDWLGLEQALRAYVRETKNADVDEIVAAFTKRGHELLP
jgi:hypothetical protein